MKDEILVNIQIALFFKVFLVRPDQFFHTLNEKLDNIFDQPPLTLPIEGPPELPVIQARSKNGIFMCNIAKGRIDFFVSGEGRQKYSDKKDDFIAKIKIVFDFFYQKTEIRRIGFVTKFFFEDKSPSETIAKLIITGFKDTLRDGKIYQSYVRYATRDELINLKINNHTVVEKISANIDGVGSGIPGVLITRDFNTIPEEDYSSEINLEKIGSFIDEGEKMFYIDKLKKVLWNE